MSFRTLMEAFSREPHLRLEELKVNTVHDAGERRNAAVERFCNAISEHGNIDLERKLQ